MWWCEVINVRKAINELVREAREIDGLM